MKKETLRKIAKENGYKDELQMLRDYRLSPTIYIPKHKPIEILKPILKHYIRGSK